MIYNTSTLVKIMTIIRLVKYTGAKDVIIIMNDNEMTQESYATTPSDEKATCKMDAFVVYTS